MKQKTQNINLHISKLIVLERKTVFYLQNNHDAALHSKLIFCHDVSKHIILQIIDLLFKLVLLKRKIRNF